MNLRERLPSRSDTFAVYSAVVFWSYTWGILLFLFNLPSWLLMSPLGDILAYFSYEMAAIFLDTLLLLAILVLAAFFLPSSWLKTDFAVTGAALAGILFFWVTIIQISFVVIVTLFSAQIVMLIVVAFASLIMMALVVRRIAPIRRFVAWFASNASLFVYIYGFFTALGFIVILLRNLF